MTKLHTALTAALLALTPAALTAEDRVSIAPIAGWLDTPDATDDADDATVVNNGPIIVIGDRSDRRDNREDRRDRYLPQSCLQTVKHGWRTIEVFEAGCLRSSHIEVRELPRQCHASIQTRDGVVYGFEPNCLWDEGYRLANR